MNIHQSPDLPLVRIIGLSGIAINTPQRRALQPDTVEQLASSMKEVGLLNPITIRPREGDMGYYLIAGRHRYEAAKKLKWESVPALILEGITADDAELAEIDENLIRANLTPAEESLHHARRKELYEKKYPETKRGAAGGAATKAKSKGANPQTAVKPSYAEDVAAKTGKSRDTVERAVRRGKEIPNIASLPGTSLDKGAELDALAKMPPERQSQLIEKARAGEKVSARDSTKGRQQPVHKPKTASLDAPKPKPVPSPPIVSSAGPAKSSKPSVNTAPPLNSFSWSDATPDGRRNFIDAIGVIPLWEAMTEEQQTQLINHINALQDAADASKIESAYCA
jgi:ParB-like chromosome segregation protein Spo0J